MDLQNFKCVMVINEELPIGVIANTAGILGMGLGKNVPEALGPDVMDRNGNLHAGIAALPIPILKASKEKLKVMRAQLFQPSFAEVKVIDFSDIAQSCYVYEEYIEKVKHAQDTDFTYHGIGLYGPKKKVNKMTGDLPLLR